MGKEGRTRWARRRGLERRAGTTTWVSWSSRHAVGVGTCTASGQLTTRYRVVLRLPQAPPLTNVPGLIRPFGNRSCSRDGISKPQHGLSAKST